MPASVDNAAGNKKHRPIITPTENAVMCFLRLNPKVAKSYGIDVDGNTSPGSMLLQTLESQGMDVQWFDRMPAADPKGLTANQKAAAFIKSISRRPGARVADDGVENGEEE